MNPSNPFALRDGRTSNKKLSKMPKLTIKANVLDRPGVPQDVSISDIADLVSRGGSSPGGGVPHVNVTLNFGATFTDKATATVTGESWVGSNVVASVLTPAGTDPDEMYLLGLRPYISNIVAGDGFTVTLYSETEAKGSYTVSCVGG